MRPPTPSSWAPDENKEWFDLHASEVDCDKSPTDLFQALETRQFTFAEDICKRGQVKKKMMD